MIELWKLPKAKRTSVESEVEKLRKELTELQIQILRTKNILHSQEWLLTQKECQFKALCNMHNIKSS